MASATIFGHFTVIDGSIINSPNNGRLTYALYNTSVYTADLQSAFPALLRCFLPNGASPYADNTTVFLHGRICSPTSQIFLIEAINMFSYPGELTDANYGVVPAFAPRICTLGHVSGDTDFVYDGRRVFRITSAAYVRDQLQTTNFMAYFANTIRWKKTNTPNVGAAIYIIGPLVGRHQESNLPLITIEDITFNAGSRHDQPANAKRSAFVPKAHMPPMNNMNNVAGNSTQKAITSKGSERDPIPISSGSSSGDTSDQSRHSFDERPPISSRTRARATDAQLQGEITNKDASGQSLTQAQQQNTALTTKPNSRGINASPMPPHISYGGHHTQAAQVIGNKNNVRQPTPYPYQALANLMVPNNNSMSKDIPSRDIPAPFDPERDGPEEMRKINESIAESERSLAEELLRLRAEYADESPAGDGAVRPQDTLPNGNNAPAEESTDTGEHRINSPEG
ncbi:hypothetical protein M422DRAFT_265270 [Sphaerobolus stellatus SS14]|uniref:Uncharacterized protein n=1 Tax=Sphaerobolus stellatus (strain SS14) TaxID=990650 RepID=A0A0C9UDZ5_SPHS4|nr:hypothetical protein M422DRAFT_265270 [Sphaerobolus stellatus SS14]